MTLTDKITKGLGPRLKQIMTIALANPRAVLTCDQVAKQMVIDPWAASGFMSRLVRSGHLARIAHGRYSAMPVFAALEGPYAALRGTSRPAPAAAPPKAVCAASAASTSWRPMPRGSAPIKIRKDQAADMRERAREGALAALKAPLHHGPWTPGAAKRICGGLSRPSKMPGFGYNLPASRCIIGSQLRRQKNTVCSRCYAHLNWYGMASVVGALEYRFHSLRHSQWVDAMVYLIGRPESSRSGVFRWHDSGDLQADWHLDNVVAIASALPDMRFWLPTREYGIVSAWLKRNGEFPANLCVRLSAHMINGDPPTGYGLPISTVSRGPAPIDAFPCPAADQGHVCAECRACWTQEVTWVDYQFHN